MLPFHQTELGCALVGAQRWEIESDGIRVGLQVSRSRSLPWLNVVRVQRLGRGFTPEAASRIVALLADTVRARPVLQLRLEIWSERDEERHQLAAACAAAGFRRAMTSHSYQRTIWMDLGAPDEALLAGFHPTARRHIRAPEKKGFFIRPITNPAAAPRLASIFSETFQRTGGRPPQVPWDRIVEGAGAPEAAYALLGLFREDDVHGERPSSFAMAILHGDVAEYAHAGSTRDPSIRVPLLYAPTWALMRWARDRGARWWDFGGITDSVTESSDPRVGISDFKRYFSKEEREVGEEWVLEPRPAAARLAEAARKLLRRRQPSV